MFEIRRLNQTDGVNFRNIRLKSLTDFGHAFGQTVAEFSKLSHEDVLSLIVSSTDRVRLGAFTQTGKLIDTAGFRREAGEKLRHKGRVWAVFVEESYQGQGLGYQLMSCLIEEARLREGITQLTLAVVDSQLAAKKIYETLGFATYGIEPRGVRHEDTFFTEAHMFKML